MTCTDGVRNIEKTADNALVVIDVPDYGEWTVSALRDDLPSDTVTVIVDTAKQYTIALAFFTSIITVTVEAGSTVTCTKGDAAQTETSTGSVIFTVEKTGTYAITAAKNGQIKSGMVQVTTSGRAKTIFLAYAMIYAVS